MNTITQYPPFMRNEAKHLAMLGLGPAKVAEHINLIADTNRLNWPRVDRKLMQKWRESWRDKHMLYGDRKGSADNRHLVFVYGTLKRGHGNNRLLKTASFWSSATTARHFVMYDGGFPRVAEISEVVEQDRVKGGHISGELWLVDDQTLSLLDALEGVPHHYRRDHVTVLVGNTAVVAGMYVIQPQRHLKNALVPSKHNKMLCWPTNASH